MNQSILEISAVVIKREDKFSAQCLEYNIAAQGSSISESVDNLFKTILAQMVLMIQQGQNPIDDLPEAPEYYWKLFKSGQPIPDDTFSLRYVDKIPEDLKSVFNIIPRIQEIRLAEAAVAA